MSQTTIDQSEADKDQAAFDADMEYLRSLVDQIVSRPWQADAAIQALDELEPITHVSMCPCGSRLEIRGELDAEDYEAIADFDYVHQDCCAEAENADEAESVAL